jgi:hypothetical protein
LIVGLDVTIAGISKEKAGEHKICPYSNAVRGNIDVPIITPVRREIQTSLTVSACSKINPLLVLPALRAYYACMENTQYTIRAVPAAIDRALRRRAKQEDKSLNAVAVEALTRGLELDAQPIEHTDLDGLIGSWKEDKAFDLAIADFERLDDAVGK